jgi:transcriptional regulator with XRE-family HTH domain
MNNLKTWLKAHDMTHERLAEKLNMTRENVTLNANADKPSSAFLWKFAVAFGLDAAISLIGEANWPPKEQDA